GGLFADRAADHGAFFEGSGVDRGVSVRRRHSCTDGAGSIWRRATDADGGAPASGEGDQFRNHLWALTVWVGAATGDLAESSGTVHQCLFRAVSRGEGVSGPRTGGDPEDGNDADAVRADSADSRNYVAAGEFAGICRADSAEFAVTRDGGGFDQAGDDSH